MKAAITRLAAVILIILVVAAGAAGVFLRSRGTTHEAATPSSPQAGNTSGGGGNGTITVVDLLGRRVVVPANVTRVVAVGPGALRIIVYLNATKYVVGVEEVEKKWDPTGRVYIMSHPELRSLPTISPGGPGKMPDAEMIVRVHPQVIFATFLTRSQADELQEKTGIPVVDLGNPVLTSVGSLQQLYKALTVAGTVLHRQETAARLISYIKSVVWDLENRTRGVNQTYSVYVGGIGYKGKHGITSTWCHYPLFALLGVESVVDESGCHGGHVDVDKGFLLKTNPDIIFIDENGLPLIIQDYREDPQFYQSLNAFQHNRIYGILPFNYYATNYELALADAYYIGKILYPNHFTDVDPAAKANEIMIHFNEKPVYDTLAKYYGGYTQLNLTKLAEGG